jgi:S-methylmethionine-dependent homocysteine/selenocysteine methylase
LPALLEPFPIRVRAPDALHLAFAEFLRQAGQTVPLASYDAKLTEAARALEFDVAELP